MGQQCVIIMTLLLAYYYVACNANSLESMSYQPDLYMGTKNQQQHKRYQSSEPSEYNTIEGKADYPDVFDELQPDIYENLIRLVKDVQKGRARISIRYRPNLGKRAQLYK